MKKYLLVAAIIIMVYGCDSEKKEYASSGNQNSTMPADQEIASSDTVAITKIIKTADMHFRVKDVQETKEKLSANVKVLGGALVEFSINSIIQKSEKVKYSIDSLKEISSYRKQGVLIAKVPSEKLDEFTNTVAKMAVFVDNQSLKMDDQSIVYLSNKLKAQNRSDALSSIRNKSTKKGNDVTSSMYIKDDYIDRKIENMTIDNQVKFSTITLNFYQDHTVKTLIVANDNLYDYRPGFFKRLGLNLMDGWVYFKELILAISHLWVLVLLGFALFFGVKYLSKRKG